MSVNPDDDLTGKCLGEYLLKQKIIRTEWSTIYRAQHRQSGEALAVKVLTRKSIGDPVLLKRFVREAKAAGMINDSHVVKVHTFGMLEDLYYIVMEFVDGMDLMNLMRTKPFDVKNAALLTRSVAKGLAAAHREGITHRDVKPSNILVSTRGAIKLTDFGLAKDDNKESNLTGNTARVGTPHYMAPEQWLGDPVDYRADIYCLGGTFYHLIFRRPPFGEAAYDELRQLHLEAEPDMSDLPDLSVFKQVKQTIAKMMAKKPSERYADYGELVNDLNAIIAGLQAIGK